MEEFKKIGKLTKTHGLSGEICLRVDEDRKLDLFTTQKIYVEHHGYKVPYFIDELKDTKPIRIKIEDISSPEEAHTLTSKSIYLSKEDLTELEEDLSGLSFGFLVGLDILLLDGSKLAKIEDILSYPQQEMAVITVGDKEMLIPINESFIVEISPENNTITMDLPEGILDL